MSLKMIQIVILSLLALSTSAQGQCDPVTEYEEAGMCCKKCGPGHKMLRTGGCFKPHCEQCPDDEYQDKYTTEYLCKLQPYCDPNKNFQTIVNRSSRVSCVCAPGFRCSSDLCPTCVPRSVCLPGQQATRLKDQLQDECEKCPGETFTDRSSWNNSCVAWTECKDGFVEETPGSDTTDRSCSEVTVRSHVALAVICPVLLALVIAGCVCYHRGQRQVIISCDERFMICIDKIKVQTVLQSCFSPQTPEKRVVVDAPLLIPEEMDDPVSVTAGGNPVAQEEGKCAALSMEESRTRAHPS